VIVKARLEAAHRQALSAGWYAAAFQRQKTMKPLGELLNPPKRGGAAGSARVLDMFRRMAAKQAEQPLKVGTGDGNG
jgi:hypothetical protein